MVRLLEESNAPQSHSLSPAFSGPSVETQEEVNVQIEILKPEVPTIRLSPEDMELLKQEQAASSQNTSPIPLTFGGIPYGTAVRTIGKLFQNSHNQ